jgi:hypothetical protein
VSRESIHDAVERLARAGTAPDFGAGLTEIIDLAAAQTPHADWARLRAVDTAGEAAHLRAWFEASLAAQPPAEPLHGLFFTVCNPVLANGDATTDLDLGGTRFSDAEDPGWLFTQVYRPPSYAGAPFLHQLYGIAYGTRDYRHPVSGVLKNDAEYPLGLAYAVLAAHAILDGRTSRDVPCAAPVISVAAGFGEGDIALVGDLTATGLVPNTGPIWA